MENHDMGRVLTEATLENIEDLWAAKARLDSWVNDVAFCPDGSLVATASNSLEIWDFKKLTDK